MTHTEIHARGEYAVFAGDDPLIIITIVRKDSPRAGEMVGGGVMIGNFKICQRAISLMKFQFKSFIKLRQVSQNFTKCQFGKNIINTMDTASKEKTK